MKNMKKILVLLTAFLLIFTFAACAGNTPPASSVSGSAPSSSESSDAQWVPEREIQCIVPFAPGGGSDILTRTIMEYIDLPKGMVAINIEGGAGLVGAQECANADADGYTILAHNPMNLIAQGLTGTNNLWKELNLLAFVVDDWCVVSTNKTSGWKSVEEFAAYAKEHPGEVKWGVTGSGITMADTLRAIKALDIECTVVPYDGGSNTRAALLGNHIQIEMSTSSDVANYVASGDVVPLFVIASVRCPSLPDVPTMLELGYEVDTGAPRAYYAPAGLDQKVLTYLEGKLKDVCDNKDFVKDCADQGFVVQFVGSKEGTERMQNWYDSNLPVFKEYGLG